MGRPARRRPCLPAVRTPVLPRREGPPLARSPPANRGDPGDPRGTAVHDRPGPLPARRVPRTRPLRGRPDCSRGRFV